MKGILRFKATFINFERPLWEFAEDLEDYYKRFCHWRGNPSILVDKHYNKEAHAIVSDKFLQEFLPPQQNNIDY